MQPEMYTGPVIQGRRTAVSLNRFMMKVYGLLSFMFLASGIGAMWGMNQGLSVVGLHPILLAIAMFGTLFLLMAVQKVPGVNLIVTTFFATLMGASLGPMLFALLRTANGGAILSDALFLTMAIFFSLSIYAIVSGKSFSFMGSFLFTGLIIVVVLSIVQIFFHPPLFQAVLSGVASLLFSGLILYDTSRILESSEDELSPVMAVVSLYLDVFNLFVSLLRLLEIFKGED
ncbi:MAG: Bax inhibitor-1/YccA family protein [Nitrospirota bacterium]|nr:Bax inhibitor-1/YccA family protein [Nitrospirota bacterium]